MAGRFRGARDEFFYRPLSVRIAPPASAPALSRGLGSSLRFASAFARGETSFRMTVVFLGSAARYRADAETARAGSWRSSARKRAFCSAVPMLTRIHSGSA